MSVLRGMWKPYPLKLSACNTCDWWRPLMRRNSCSGVLLLVRNPLWTWTSMGKAPPYQRVMSEREATGEAATKEGAGDCFNPPPPPPSPSPPGLDWPDRFRGGRGGDCWTVSFSPVVSSPFTRSPPAFLPTVALLGGNLDIVSTTATFDLKVSSELFGEGCGPSVGYWCIWPRPSAEAKLSPDV